VICPYRFLERRVIFADCLGLIRHEAGDELHVVPEISIPGGSVDYFLVSAPPANKQTKPDVHGAREPHRRR
jgi:hypothetical protein